MKLASTNQPRNPEESGLQESQMIAAAVNQAQFYSQQGSQQGTLRLPSMFQLLLFGLVLFLLWAGLFEIDSTVRAQGQIIPSVRTQIIQAADGGVLGEVFVEEGQVVAAGELLAVLEKERADASYEESRSKVAALRAALIRVRAETVGQYPSYGSEFDGYAGFVAVERSLYEQRKKGLQDELDTLQEALAMAEEELRMNESLMATGDTSRLEVMRARGQVSELQGKISSVTNKYLREASQEATKLEAELASSRYKLKQRASVLLHTDLRSPVEGIVKYLKINTVGGVLRAGDELMQISPTEGEMVVEIKISPIDIGQLSLGLPVSIKLDAFDYSIYGALPGELIYISADTLTEDDGDGGSTTYYRARIRIDDNLVEANPQLAAVALKPGMTTLVDIRIGSRTILRYLAKPVLKAFDGALNER